MADLDDFFAKKDKKKTAKKGVARAGAASPAGQQASAAEGGEKAATAQPATLNVNVKPTLFKDDDWIVPEEKTVDYSGLRIQDLSVTEQEEKPESEETSADAPQAASKKSWTVSKKPVETEVNSISFPSLSQSTGDAGAPPPPGMRNFKTVKNGYRGEGSGMRTSDRVQLANRYQAFDD